MGDDQRARQLRRQSKALGGFGAQQVLHRHRLAGAHQHAVKHRVGALVGARAAVGGHIEAPRLDAALPVAPDKGHVLGRTGRVRSTARADEIAFRPASIAVALRRLGRQAVELRPPLRVGGGLRQRLATAVRHCHTRPGHRLALVQRGHPGQCVASPQLEVHAQVGHQRAGAHIHAARRAVLGVQQGRAEQRRGNFDHIKTRRQRNADHLKRARVALGGLLQIERLGALLAGQQRHHARLHAVLVLVRQHRWQGALHIAARSFAFHGIAVVALHLAVPVNDFGIGGRLQRADFALRRRCAAAGLQPLHAQRGFHIAQRHRQQRRAVRPFGKTLQNAKRRSGKLGQWRHGTGLHRERKAVGIHQWPAGSVGKVLGQREGVSGAFGQRRGKGDALDQRVGRWQFAVCALHVTVHLRRQRLACAFELHGRRQLVGHGCAELQRQRPDRQTGGLGVFTLAAQLGAERCTHGVGEAFFNPVGNAAGGGHTHTPHQLQFAARCQAPVAGECGKGQRRFGRLLVQPLVLEQRSAVCAVHQPHRHAFAHAFGCAPYMLLHAGQGGRAVELQHKELLFVDRLPGARQHVFHKRPTAIEFVADSARQR